MPSADHIPFLLSVIERYSARASLIVPEPEELEWGFATDPRVTRKLHRVAVEDVELYGDGQAWLEGCLNGAWMVSSAQRRALARAKWRVALREGSHPPPAAIPELYPWQREALTAWDNSGHRGVIEAVTGAGKSLLGVIAVKRAVASGGKALILVPSQVLLRQWKFLLERYLGAVRTGIHGAGRRDSLEKCEVLVTTVQSAMRVAWRSRVPANSLLVADEVHRYGSLHFSKALDVKFGRRLGLSATYDRNDFGKDAHLLPYFGPTCFRLGYGEALAAGVVAPFRVLLVGTDFRPIEREEYEYYDAIATSRRAALISHCGLNASTFAEFMAEVQFAAKYGIGYERALAQEYLSAFAGRRGVLANTVAKVSALPSLTAVFHAAARALVFTETVHGAQAAAAAIASQRVRASAVHSQLGPRERREVMHAFRTRRVKVLCAPRVLDEGVDVPEADVGVVVAASQTTRQMIQRMGRVIRRKAGNAHALFVVLYVRDTKEDPAWGSYEGFLSAMTTHAEAVATIGTGELSTVPLRFWKGEDYAPSRSVAEVAMARAAEPPIGIANRTADSRVRGEPASWRGSLWGHPPVLDGRETERSSETAAFVEGDGVIPTHPQVPLSANGLGEQE